MTRFLPRALAAALAIAFAPCAPAALDVAGIDRAIDPCTDFYAFANHRWLETTRIPDDRPAWGMMAIMSRDNQDVMVRALEDALKRPLPAKGSAQRKALDYYASGMDTAAIAKAGLAPLEPHFKRIAAVEGPQGLARAVAALHRQGIKAGFEFNVDQDSKESTRYLPEIVQGGLGLPDRDYYFLDDERTQAQRAAYRKHVGRMFELAGDAPEAAARSAETVLALETELARASMTAVERRDVDKTYNKTTVAALASAAPDFPWKEYFDALGTARVQELNVAQPAYFAALARLAKERPASEWRTYLRWQVLNASASKLPEALEQEDFAFNQTVLQGTKAQPPRERRVIEAMGGRYGERGLGQALGRIYVDQAFSPQAKARALELVNNVKAALGDRLRSVDWMSEDTRAKSLDKLAKMNVKIGYPDVWRDYSKADVGAYPFVENWLRANAFDHERLLARIGAPVDRGDWWMSPQIVNAYYNARRNEIVFPAGILQPPFFDMKADDAVNYGGIGMVIGHEITHGFDDRGRRFDAQGNLRDWWTEDDARRYKERAAKVERQYGGFEGVEGVKVNGALTLGENISDVGGLKIAYLALQKAEQAKPAGAIDGLTPDQRFFLAYAQGWRSLARTEQERLQLRTDGHSPARFRVRGPLANMPEFARAFSCDPSKALIADIDRANIW